MSVAVPHSGQNLEDGKEVREVRVIVVSSPILGCSAMYCFDPLLISQPVLLGVSPTKGLASGGTSVTVKVKNWQLFRAAT